MSVFFSRSCEYGIQAVLYLASREPESPIHLRDISNALRIPHHFLSKIMQTLERDGVVISHKGANGGFELGRDAKEISIINIVRAIDGEAFLNGCVLGFPSCDDTAPCPVHTLWKKSKENISVMLEKSSVGELSAELGGKLEFIKSLYSHNNPTKEINV
ncbi:MAG: Rrf2 family transcriptional regulator [Ignavibacteriales bacterium]|nr:Rrf2 family transcriptional regulator [Ignavibacteriales bacterium]